MCLFGPATNLEFRVFKLSFKIFKYVSKSVNRDDEASQAPEISRKD